MIYVLAVNYYMVPFKIYKKSQKSLIFSEIFFLNLQMRKTWSRQFSKPCNKKEESLIVITMESNLFTVMWQIEVLDLMSRLGLL